LNASGVILKSPVHQYYTTINIKISPCLGEGLVLSVQKITKYLTKG
jgi:hypothetical protein